MWLYSTCISPPTYGFLELMCVCLRGPLCMPKDKRGGVRVCAAVCPLGLARVLQAQLRNLASTVGSTKSPGNSISLTALSNSLNLPLFFRMLGYGTSSTGFQLGSPRGNIQRDRLNIPPWEYFTTTESTPISRHVDDFCMLPPIQQYGVGLTMYGALIYGCLNFWLWYYSTILRDTQLLGVMLFLD